MDDQHHANRHTKPSPDSSPRSDTGCNSTTTSAAANTNIADLGNNSNNTTSIGVGSSGGGNREQDRFLPIANVGRIMKKAIPSSGKVSKDAKETVQECVSEFISFVTGEASDKCQREKRKTINGDDLIWAITTLGFDDYVNPLKLYLLRYRELEGEKMTMPKQHHADQQQQQVPSSTSDSPQSSLMYAANQHFSLPFSPDAIHQQQPNIDPRAQW